MKFTSISTYTLLLLAFSPGASSFVSNAGRFPARPLSTAPRSFTNVIPVSQVAHSSSELNLFGSRWRKTRQINSESKVGKAPITESEVRGLFELWNSALATGDSRIVASRYTKVCLTMACYIADCMLKLLLSNPFILRYAIREKSPVLLPTVSDQPRTNYDSVKNYFDTFLLKKPQGTTRLLHFAFSAHT